MNCTEADELLGAYAADALTADEAAAFRAHIAGCADHASKAAEMRAVASALAATVDPVPPPAALRSRLLDAVAREPQDALAGAAPPRRIETAPSVGAAGRSPGAPWRSVRPLQAWGALAAAIIAALLVWNVALQSGDGGDDARFAADRATSISTLEAHNANGSGTALYFKDEKAVVVVADGIDQLDSSQTYQLWALTGDRPTSLGVAHPDNGGRMSLIVPFDASSASGIAITVEPAGGSDQPTSDPVFTAELRS